MIHRSKTPITAIARTTSGPHRVSYRDTDRMGHVYYAQYLVWMELARTDFLRSLGACYKDWEDKAGIFLPVRHCEVAYRTPAEYDDLILVEIAMTRLTRASVEFQYEIMRQGDNHLLATGNTNHPFVDRNGQIKRIADTLLPQFF